MSIMNFVNSLLNRTNIAPKSEVVVSPVVEVPAEAPKVATYQSKWGYHPVSYETFLKLRELRKWYFMALHDVAAWFRWNRKTVYKSKVEPLYCKTFVLDKGETRKRTDKEGHIHWIWYPKTRTDLGICDAFQSARMPMKTSEEVVQLKISDEEINRLHTEVSKFFNK